MSTTVDTAVLGQIMTQLELLQMTQQVMQVKLDNLSPGTPTSPPPLESKSLPNGNSTKPTANPSKEKSLYPGQVLLTAYPSQHSITPYPLTWGAPMPLFRGPIICSCFPFHNALSAHSGSYSIYCALSIAMGTLDPTYKFDYTMTQPPVEIHENPTWRNAHKIVSMNPWGHFVLSMFEKGGKEGRKGGEGLDIHPLILLTKAHIKLKEIDKAVRRGEIVVDVMKYITPIIFSFSLSQRPYWYNTPISSSLCYITVKPPSITDPPDPLH
ncbi:MAG: GTP cyclohydrolase N terminal-domain-containing protein [Lentinula lateritia]|nr:MAG: GTP cyclohydrolase N terminal-domain-containing protein [Lentinula lateritia]